MAKWAVVVSEERYSQERLYASQFVPGTTLPAGDEALLVAALDPPVVFGVARADAEGRLRYTVDLIDAPLPFAATLGTGTHPLPPQDAGPHPGSSAGVPAAGTDPLPSQSAAGAGTRPLEAGAHPLDEAAFTAVASAATGPSGAAGAAGAAGVAGKRTWLVSVDLPIEAASPAEAVREFWTYVRDLGPAELPAFVWPVGDELAMQAFVLGAEANQDPEED